MLQDESTEPHIEILHITWVGLGGGAWVDDEFQARWAKFYLEGQKKWWRIFESLGA